MRQELIQAGQVFSRFPKDPYLRGRYFKLYRLYNKNRKHKRKQYKNSLLSKLDNLRVDNPKEYWKLINEIQGKRKNDCASNIESDIWVKHFKTLHSSVDEKFKNRVQVLENIVKEKEKSLTSNELDKDISDKGILKAIYQN